ncbi:MAG: lytic transglycosylase domain-containing protein [Brevinema sp.]
MKRRLHFVICLFLTSFAFANQEIPTNLAEVFIDSEIINTSVSVSNISIPNKTSTLSNVELLSQESVANDSVIQELIPKESNQNIIEKTVLEDESKMKTQIGTKKQLIPQQSLPKNLLEGEYPLIIKEFRDIVKLYQKLPSNQDQKVKLLRSLSTRLKNIEPKTSFLKSQKTIMEASILYRLTIRGTAANMLENVIQESPFMEIRDKSARIFVSYALVNGEINNIKKFHNKYQSYLSPELNTMLLILTKNPSDIKPDEASFILQNLVLSPKGSHHPADIALRTLGTIKAQINITELDAAINLLLHDKDEKLVFSLIKVRLMLSDVSDDQLYTWGRLLGKNQREFIRILQSVNIKRYQPYISQYYKKANAENRGRVYNVKLYRYRGEKKTPYNLESSEKSFKEYLKGDIEERYLGINAEYAFRNFLAFKRYDKIIEYASIIKEKSVPTLSYINFWYAYSLLQIGQTNNVVELLGDAIADDPESYYGLLSKNLIKTLFKKSYFVKNSYFNSMKLKSSKSYMDLIKYAHILYYLGSRGERSQAEKIYLDLGLMRNSSRTKISNDKKILFHAYLDLGFTKDAQSLSYSDGIYSPYTRDMMVGEYLLNQNKVNDFKTIITQRSTSIHNSLTVMMPKDSLKMYYPLLYCDSMVSMRQKTKRPMDIYLLYSVMRAESFYKTNARSRVGARGLMQIMPKTGQWLAEKYLERGTVFTLNKLYEPELNIYFGSMYLYDNIDRMGVIPALAAYNSGPTYVNKLIKQYQPNTDLELVEIHPKRETRNYVRKIMEFYHRYKSIYEGQEVEIFSLLS